MKEADSIFRIKADLDRLGSTKQQLRLVMPELDRIMKQSREMGLMTGGTLTAGMLPLDFASNNLSDAMTRAFRETEKLAGAMTMASREAEKLQLVGMAGTLVQMQTLMGPLHNAVEMARGQFVLQMDAHYRALDALKLADETWLRRFQSLGARMAEMARINFAIPETALLNWPHQMLTVRAPLLNDCVFNMVALEKLHAAAILPEPMVSPEQLTVANQFVFDHAEVVRRLPPRLPRPDVGEQAADGQAHRDQEIGAKLDHALRDFDLRLLSLRRKAWGCLASGGVDDARLAMAGIREVFTDILHALSPDDKVKELAMWRTRPKSITQPTRLMRLVYILGEERASEADALLQFNKSINRTQKYVHTFADDPELVRIQMAQLEGWIYLLLLHAKQR